MAREYERHTEVGSVLATGAITVQSLPSVRNPFIISKLLWRVGVQ